MTPSSPFWLVLSLACRISPSLRRRDGTARCRVSAIGDRERTDQGSGQVGGATSRQVRSGYESTTSAGHQVVGSPHLAAIEAAGGGLL